MLNTRKRMKISIIVVIILIFVNISTLQTNYSSARTTHNGVTLISKWTWDEPRLDGTIEPLWSTSPLYSFSIWNRNGGNQSFSLRFLNNENYMFVAVSWSDTDEGQGDSLRLYFDEDHDALLTTGNEDYRQISRSSSSWSLYDRHYDSGSWITDNLNGSLAGSLSPTYLELKIPIGNNAEEYDLNSTFPGDSVGFHINATDTDFFPPSPPVTRSSTHTGIYGTDTDPTNWANLELASKPDLDFTINLEPSSTVLEVGETFFVTCFISNNANSTGTVPLLNVTILIPNSIDLAPTVEQSHYLDDLNSASTHSWGYNHTFIWTLIANEVGHHIIDVIVDGVGIPQMNNKTTINIVSPFPEIHLISPGYGEAVSGTFLLQVFISHQGTLEIAQYNLNNQGNWINLTLNTSSSFYEASIDSQTLGDYLTIRARDDLEKQILLTINVSEGTIQPIKIDIDNSPPKIVIINPQNGSLLNGLITIQLSVIDGTGVASVEFRVDQGIWTSMAKNNQNSYYEYTLDTQTMSDGTHTIELRASDSLGNMHSSSMIKTFSVSILNYNISSEEPTTGSSITKDMSTEDSDTSRKTSTTDGFGLIIGITLLSFIGYYKKKY